MESLQKAVAKELLKRQQQANVHSSEATQPPAVKPISARETDDQQTPEHPVTSQPAESSVSVESIPTLTRPEADDPWFPDEQTLLRAIERARPRDKKKTLSNSGTTEAANTSKPPQPTIDEATPNQDKADSGSPLTPSTNAGSELPDAYQRLLQSSFEQGTEPTPHIEDNSSTPNPFGRQRKRSQEQESETDKDSGNKRRSLRGWFTPGRESDAEETDD